MYTLFKAQENVDPSWVRVWLLDMALAGDGKVSVLMAAHNPNISQQVHFAIGMVSLKLHYTLNINNMWIPIM